eukprot:783388-Alexandrium_andersonii.AAC.1
MFAPILGATTSGSSWRTWAPYQCAWLYARKRQAKSSSKALRRRACRERTTPGSWRRGGGGAMPCSCLRCLARSL